MVTNKDQEAFNLIEDFNIMTTNQIHRLCYKTSLRYVQQRLSYLHERDYIKRTYNAIGNGYAYYMYKLPDQVRHNLIRAELYTSMKEKYEILNWKNWIDIHGVRPDALAYVNNHGIKFPLFIEIHLRTKFDFDKYIKLMETVDLKSMYEINPRIIICTDQKLKIPTMGLRVRVVSLDMKGLDSIFK